MASPSANINGALVTGYRAAGIGIDVDAKTSYENFDFVPPADAAPGRRSTSSQPPSSSTPWATRARTSTRASCRST